MKFLPRRDLWLSIIVWVCVGALVAASLAPVFADDFGVIGGIVFGGIMLLIAVILVFMWTNVYYILHDEHLFIRNGPFKIIVPYTSITRVTPTRSVLASAATSTRRIEIMHGKYDLIHVSPLNEDEFLQELKKHCPYAQFTKSI